MNPSLWSLTTVVCLLVGCTQQGTPTAGENATGPDREAKELLSKYTSFALEADLSGLSDAQRSMLPMLIRA